MDLDQTAWLAILAVAGTLAGALSGTILGPWVTEAARRKTERQMRLHDERVSAYGELLAAVARLTENAVTRASFPLADNLSEPNDDELRRLLGRVRVVSGEEVRRQINRLPELFGRYYGQLFRAQVHHRHLERQEEVDDDKAITQRFALATIADELTAVRDQLENAIRKDLGL